MSWVKRGGGAGTGIFSKGLAAMVDGEDPIERAPRPATRAPEPEVTNQSPTGAPATPPAYLTHSWPEVRSNRIALEVIASWTSEGHEGWTSMFYDGALEAFGSDSPHLTAACHGDTNAGARYQQIAANGRYRTRNGEYWQE